jgi:hypothetical protein
MRPTPASTGCRATTSNAPRHRLSCLWSHRQTQVPLLPALRQATPSRVCSTDPGPAPTPGPSPKVGGGETAPIGGYPALNAIHPPALHHPTVAGASRAAPGLRPTADPATSSGRAIRSRSSLPALGGVGSGHRRLYLRRRPRRGGHNIRTKTHRWRARTHYDAGARCNGIADRGSTAG